LSRNSRDQGCFHLDSSCIHIGVKLAMCNFMEHDYAWAEENFILYCMECSNLSLANFVIRFRDFNALHFSGTTVLIFPCCAGVCGYQC